VNIAKHSKKWLKRIISLGLKSLLLHSLPLKDKTPTITLSPLKRILSLKLKGLWYNKHAIHMHKVHQKCTTYHNVDNLSSMCTTYHLLHPQSTSSTLGLSFSPYKKGAASYRPIHTKHLTNTQERNINTCEIASRCWNVVGVYEYIC